MPETAVKTTRRRVVQSLALASCIPTFAACVCPPFCGGDGGDAIVGLTEQPRIELTISAGAMTVPSGGSATTTVYVVVSGSATGATLSLLSPPASGVSATFNPATVVGSGTSQMTLVADAAIPPGERSLSVVATGTGPTTVTTSAAFIALVVPPITLQVPAGGSVNNSGGSVERTLSLERVAGFTAPVSFSVEPGTLPPGATIVFAPSTTTGLTTTVRLDVPTNTPVRRYSVRLLATAGAHTEAVDWDVNVTVTLLPPDFTITATPALATVTAGASASYDLAFTRSAPGIGSIVLSATGLPAGASAVFTPASVIGTTAQLEVGTTAATPPGNYTFTITGTAGALVRTTTATLVVETPPELVLSVAPASLTINQGSSAQTTVSMQRTGAVGVVTLDALSLPTGVSASFSPAVTANTTSALTLSVAASAAPGTYPISIRGVAGAITRTTTLTLTVTVPPPAPLTLTLDTPNVTIAPGQLVHIPVRISRTGAAIGRLLELRVDGVPAGGTAWITPTTTLGDSATLQIVGGAVGTSTVGVTAVFGAVNPSVTANVTVVPSATPDFALLPTPKSLNVVRSGMFTPFTLDILRSNGFVGAVSLSVVTDQPGAYAVDITPEVASGNSAALRIYGQSSCSPRRARAAHSRNGGRIDAHGADDDQRAVASPADSSSPRGESRGSAWALRPRGVLPFTPARTCRTPRSCPLRQDIRNRVSRSPYRAA